MKKNLIITAILGVFTIILGAFGAHILKDRLHLTLFNAFETAVKYQMYHVIVLLFVNSFDKFNEKIKNNISTLFFIGILFFSGSIYAITIFGVPAKSIWFITPLGGLFFIVGWIMMAYYFIKKL